MNKNDSTIDSLLGDLESPILLNNKWAHGIDNTQIVKTLFGWNVRSKEMGALVLLDKDHFWEKYLYQACRCYLVIDIRQNEMTVPTNQLPQTTLLWWNSWKIWRTHVSMMQDSVHTSVRGRNFSMEYSKKYREA